MVWLCWIEQSIQTHLSNNAQLNNEAQDKALSQNTTVCSKKPGSINTFLWFVYRGGGTCLLPAFPSPSGIIACALAWGQNGLRFYQLVWPRLISIPVLANETILYTHTGKNPFIRIHLVIYMHKCTHKNSGTAQPGLKNQLVSQDTFGLQMSIKSR